MELELDIEGGPWWHALLQEERDKNKLLQEELDRKGGVVTTFTAEQEMDLLNWLTYLKDSGLELNDVIKGIEDGTLTQPVEDEDELRETLQEEL